VCEFSDKTSSRQLVNSGSLALRPQVKAENGMKECFNTLKPSPKFAS
jgi:hypothetical protein